MRITTIKEHQYQIDLDIERNVARLDMDDACMSSWSSDVMIRANKTAIEALELGKEVGIDGPAVVAIRLFDKFTGTQVDATEIPGKFGRAWLLEDAPASKYGRRFIPIGKNSRIQRELSLEERKIVVPAAEYMRATTPACVGSPMHYYAVPQS